jgi:hypothetical protein
MRGQNRVAHGPKYLTRANVDLYFQEIVAHREIQPTGAQRVVSALQRYANREEYVDGQTTFKVMSSSIEQALLTHLLLYKVRVGDKLLDPHSKLPTNMLTVEESETAVRAALTQQNWRDLAFSWTTCEQSFLRNDSIRKLYLPDIVLNSTHGPKEKGMDSYCIAYILHKQVHKDNANRLRVVGVWRHKNFVRCSIGMLAFNIFHRLNFDNKLHFYKSKTPGKVPDWYNFKLIEWNSAISAYEAYDSLLKKCSLKWQKVTHLRKLGMEYGSARGELTEDELAPQSKHQTSKCGSRYVTELYAPVLRG